jgi:protein-disulfide isomerase
MRRTVTLSVILLLLAGVAHADETVATVGSKTITREQLEKHVKAKLMQLENQRFQILQEGVDDLIASELYEQEAKARGISPKELVKKEIEDKIGEPKAEEIQQVYDDNKEDLEGQSLEEIKPQIVQYLRQQQLAERNEAFLNELRKKFKTTVALRPPTVDVTDGGRPVLGKADAPVTIIGFSDYECPFCKRGAAVIEQVIKAYGDKVRFVHRDFPLDFHANARPAAEAAACANDQGQFWQYHHKLWQADSLSEDKLKALAKELGMDEKKFNDCVAAKTHTAVIDKDMVDAQSAGVSGTPAFFVNGRMLSGAQPFEKFKEVIDEELARGGKKS